MVSPNLFLPKGDTTTTNQVLNLFNAVQQQKQQQAQAAQQQIENQFRQQQIAIQQQQAETQGGQLILGQIKAEQAMREAEAKAVTGAEKTAFTQGITERETKVKEAKGEREAAEFKAQEKKNQEVSIVKSALLGSLGTLDRVRGRQEMFELQKENVVDLAEELDILSDGNPAAERILKELASGGDLSKIAQEIRDKVGIFEEFGDDPLGRTIAANVLGLTGAQISSFGVASQVKLDFQEDLINLKNQLKDTQESGRIDEAVAGITNLFNRLIDDANINVLEDPETRPFALQQIGEIATLPGGLENLDKIIKGSRPFDVKKSLFTLGKTVRTKSPAGEEFRSLSKAQQQSAIELAKSGRKTKGITLKEMESIANEGE